MAEPDLFEMYRGDDHTLWIEIKDDNDVAVDVTGWSFKSTMKLSTELPDESAPVKVDIPPVADANASIGVITITLPKEQTKNLLATTYLFDLQAENNGAITTVFIGKVKVKGDVTWRTD